MRLLPILPFILAAMPSSVHAETHGFRHDFAGEQAGSLDEQYRVTPFAAQGEPAGEASVAAEGLRIVAAAEEDGRAVKGYAQTTVAHRRAFEVGSSTEAVIACSFATTDGPSFTDQPMLSLVIGLIGRRGGPTLAVRLGLTQQAGEGVSLHAEPAVQPSPRAISATVTPRFGRLDGRSIEVRIDDRVIDASIDGSRVLEEPVAHGIDFAALADQGNHVRAFVRVERRFGDRPMSATLGTLGLETGPGPIDQEEPNP